MGGNPEMGYDLADGGDRGIEFVALNYIGGFINDVL